jgi:hypothetical protein
MLLTLFSKLIKLPYSQCEEPPSPQELFYLNNPALKLPGISTTFSDAVWQRGKTNCYAYALDCPSAGWAVPGRLLRKRENSIPDRLITVSNMQSLLKRDGLIEISEEEALKGKFHTVACAIGEKFSCGKDFHFYRKDPDGRWSHKTGPYVPKKVSEVDKYFIEHFSRYNIFVGYFAVPENGIIYIPRNDLAAA